MDLAQTEMAHLLVMLIVIRGVSGVQIQSGPELGQKWAKVQKYTCLTMDKSSTQSRCSLARPSASHDFLFIDQILAFPLDYCRTADRMWSFVTGA